MTMTDPQPGPNDDLVFTIGKDSPLYGILHSMAKRQGIMVAEVAAEVLKDGVAGQATPDIITGNQQAQLRFAIFQFMWGNWHHNREDLPTTDAVLGAASMVADFVLLGRHAGEKIS